MGGFLDQFLVRFSPLSFREGASLALMRGYSTACSCRKKKALVRYSFFQHPVTAGALKLFPNTEEPPYRSLNQKQSKSISSSSE